MPKTTPEEITLKKEYIRFLNNQIYKLNRQQKYLTKQLARIQAQIRDYEKEKKKVEKRSKPQDNRDLSGNADLSEFTSLQSLNSYNNKFEKAINIENNPIKSKNLNNLTAEQFSRLYAKDLVARGNTSQQTNSQMAYLQNLSQQASPPAKAEVRETVRNRNNSKSPNLNTLYLIGGLVLFGIAVLVIGY
ncbi:4350_t:CDS:2 [Entrophospora sp. SA101]|nr:4350_t:CDS:2 [Entrophospora sp. SA101]